MRHFQRMIKTALIKGYHFAGDEPQSLMIAELFAALKKQLHAQTDAK